MIVNKKKGAIGAVLIAVSLLLLGVGWFAASPIATVVGFIASMFLGVLGVSISLDALISQYFPRPSVKSLTRQKDLINIFRGYPR